MRLLISTLSYSAHVHPLLALGKAAHEAGHEVAVATTPPAMPLIEAAGLESCTLDPDVPVPESLDSPAKVEQWGRDITDARALWAEQLYPYAREWRPDVVVRDRCDSSGHIVAERLDARCVVYGVALRLPADTVAQSAQLQLGSAQVAAAAGEMGERFLAEEGVDGDLWLSPYPRSYAVPGVPVLACERHVQPFVHGDTFHGERLPEWVAAPTGDPLVHVTLGTVFNRVPTVFEAVIEALADQPLNVVITVGRDRDPRQFEPLPRNIRVHRFIPYSLLLPHCDAVVAHGGSTTVTTILAHGLPIFFIPQGGDCSVNAQRCVEMGFGLSHPADEKAGELPNVALHELDTGRIREMVGALVTDPAYRRAARALQSEVRSLPTTGQVVKMIEGLTKPRPAATNTLR